MWTFSAISCSDLTSELHSKNILGEKTAQFSALKSRPSKHITVIFRPRVRNRAKNRARSRSWSCGPPIFKSCTIVQNRFWIVHDRAKKSCAFFESCTIVQKNRAIFFQNRAKSCNFFFRNQTWARLIYYYWISNTDTDPNN